MLVLEPETGFRLRKDPGSGAVSAYVNRNPDFPGRTGAYVHNKGGSSKCAVTCVAVNELALERLPAQRLKAIPEMLLLG